MVDIIKKTLLAGVGAAVVTKEKVEAVLDEFVQQGKVTSNDARAMADKIAADGRREFESASSELNARIGEFVAKLDRKTQARLTELEARVAALESTASKPPLSPNA